MKKIGALAFLAALMAGGAGAGERSSFDFGWQFKYMGKDFECATAVPADRDGFKDVQLPHDWAIESPFLANEPNETGKLPWNGNAWYVKDFEVPAGFDASKEKWFLDFDGVMQRPVVFVNGQKAGEWKYGYASFRIDATPFLKSGKNTVAVHVSNPPRSTRWYPGSGIYRNVWLEKTGDVHIDYNGVCVTTPVVTKDKAVVKVETTVVNEDTKYPKGVYVVTRLSRLKHIKLNRKLEAAPCGITLKPGETRTIETEITVPSPRLWSVEDPARYGLEVLVFPRSKARQSDEKAYDTARLAIGLRSIEWKKEGFFLNGKRVPLNGVCEHHDLGCLGAAFYAKGYERKILKLKEMGCNSIRMTHNPPAPEVLDLCDKHGILVIDELFDIWKRQKVDKIWGYHRYWNEWMAKDVRNFVMRDRNHPCVIAWSGGNEVPENDAHGESLDTARALKAEFKKYDTTRPWTVGTNNPAGKDNGFSEIQDVFGFNYKPHLYAEFRKKYPNQPLYGSETCSAISARDEYFFPFRWGQGSGNRNYQVSSYGQCAVPWGNVADQEWAKQEENAFVAGEYVWTGFDYLGEPTPYNLDASNVNNFNDLPEAEKKAMMKKLEQTAGKAPSRSSYFGLIDLAGFPKDNFYLYQSHWAPETKMAHILPHWNWPGREGQVTPVVVYSSGDEAELFLNGKSQGVRKRGDKAQGTFKQKGIEVGKNDYRFVWEEVAYQPGTLEVKVKKHGKAWATATRVTTGETAKGEVRCDRKSLGNEGHDLAHLEFALVDAKGNVVPTDCREVSFAVKGEAAKLIGFCNGNATDWTSMQDPNQKFYNGRLLAVLRGERGKTGRVTVVATPKGLAPVTFEIDVR